MHQVRPVARYPQSHIQRLGSNSRKSPAQNKCSTELEQALEPEPDTALALDKGVVLGKDRVVVQGTDVVPDKDRVVALGMDVGEGTGPGVGMGRVFPEETVVGSPDVLAAMVHGK